MFDVSQCSLRGDAEARCHIELRLDQVVDAAGCKVQHSSPGLAARGICSAAAHHVCGAYFHHDYKAQPLLCGCFWNCFLALCPQLDSWKVLPFSVEQSCDLLIPAVLPSGQQVILRAR